MPDEQETKKPKTIDMYPSTIPDGQEEVDYLFYGVQGLNNSNEKVKGNIAFVIPKTDEESQERYNCNLATLIQLGVRAGIATRPNYPLEFDGRTTDKAGKVIARGFITDAVMDSMQSLADGYKIGQKKVKKLSVIDTVVKQSGLSNDEATEALRQYVAQRDA